MTAPIKNIDQAFDNIEDEDSSLSIQERFDILGQEIVANAYYLMERRRKTGQRISDEEKQLQDDTVDQFNIVEKVFMKFKKAGRLGDVKPNENFGEQLLTKIRNKKSTIGEIVQALSQNK